MTKYSIDINNLLFATFGVYGQLRYPGAMLPGEDAPVKPFDTIEVMLDDVSDGTSIIGTPVFMPFSILPGSYPAMQIVNGAPVTTTQSFDGFDFPTTTLCSFERPKNIVKTQIEGRDNTVKELISMGDWSVRITGLLASPSGSNKYPADQVQALSNLFEVPAAMKVSGRLFQLLGIHNIVLESLNIPQIEGAKNVQPFQLTASSDEPIEITLKNS